jgi:hypothetical protein
MRHINIRLLLVAGTLALAACASNGPAKSVGTASAGGGAAAKTGAAAPDASSSAVPTGYRRVVRKGDEYFCRTESVTGSRAHKKELCFTRDELEADRSARTEGGQGETSPVGIGGAAPSR